MRSLAAPATFEIEIRRSRFVAHASRVSSLAETLAFYESVADPSASHNCWAWKLGHQYRFNDDGEPSGTAGRPILGSIEGKDLDETMVVVTRYYGGIKLGVGGLVRAYSGAASRCIDAAEVVEIQPTVRCLVEAAFDCTGPVFAAIDACGAARLEEHYGDEGISISIEVAESELSRLSRLLQDGTRGGARLRRSA